MRAFTRACCRYIFLPFPFCNGFGYGVALFRKPDAFWESSSTFFFF